MGMYDEVLIDVDVDEELAWPSFKRGLTLQTKDTECILATYVVREQEVDGFPMWMLLRRVVEKGARAKNGRKKRPRVTYVPAPLTGAIWGIADNGEDPNSKKCKYFDLIMLVDKGFVWCLRPVGPDEERLDMKGSW